MKITHEITYIKTGKTVKGVLSYPCTEDLYPIIHHWKHGNYSCDCNRSILFGFDMDEFECSEGKFCVKLYRDGELIYRDDFKQV